MTYFAIFFLPVFLLSFDFACGAYAMQIILIFKRSNFFYFNFFCYLAFEVMIRMPFPTLGYRGEHLQ